MEVAFERVLRGHISIGKEAGEAAIWVCKTEGPQNSSCLEDNGCEGCGCDGQGEPCLLSVLVNRREFI